jgi:hypothetical protein
MRTSRNTEEHRGFIREELFNRALLRQGWGYSPDQDLRIAAQSWVRSESAADQKKPGITEVRNDSESCEESQPLFYGSPFAPDSF